MSLGIISNFAANVAQRNLEQSSQEATRSIARLSSGTRVLSARDDAAALAVGSRLNAEQAALGQAQVNAGQANSLLQVADGGLARIDDIIVRMNSLAVQAASGQLDGTARGFLDDEFQSLESEINRIANDTEFNGINLLNAVSTLNFQVGTGGVASQDQIAVMTVDVTATTLGTTGDDLTTTTMAVTAIGNLTTALDALNTGRAAIGASQNRLDFASQAVATTRENTEAARSQLLDLDVARESSNFASQQILVQAGVATLGQANSLPQNLLGLFN